MKDFQEAADALARLSAPVPDTDVAQDDLREILRAVGLSDCARTYSPHEVVQHELLPHLRALRNVIEKYDGNSNNPYWAEEFNQAVRIARAHLDAPHAATPVPAREWIGSIRDIANERQRQIEKEGWSDEHDDFEHRSGELATAAVRYATNAAACLGVPPVTLNFGANWPWHPDWWKPTTPRRDLVKAAALIAAEIDRLDRALPPPFVHSEFCVPKDSCNNDAGGAQQVDSQRDRAVLLDDRKSGPASPPHAAAEPEKPMDDAEITKKWNEVKRNWVSYGPSPYEAFCAGYRAGGERERAIIAGGVDFVINGPGADIVTHRVPDAAAEPEKPCDDRLIADAMDEASIPRGRVSYLALCRLIDRARAAETPLYASPAEPKGPMNDAEQMLCESIMNKHVTAGPVSVIPVRAAVFAAYQAGKAAVQQPIAREPTEKMMAAGSDYLPAGWKPIDAANIWRAMYDVGN